MHSKLFTIAAALLASFAPVLASQDNLIRDSHSRGRARAIQRRASSAPSTLTPGWSLSAACLTDAPAPNRLLAKSDNFLTTLTPAICTANCDSQGYRYAAIQDGHECWCGSSLNNAVGGKRADVSTCSTPCAGDNTQNCGGVWHLALYSKSSNGNGTNNNSSGPSPPKRSTTSVSAPASTPSSPVTPPSKSKFKLVESMAGSSFFSHFNFFSSADPTGGQVDYVTSSQAASAKLAYVDGNGVAVMKVDNSTWLQSGQQRKSVRVQSNKSYASGLIIFDVASMPFGCSVWPAMWTVGGNWPAGGEIDLIENVNNATVNQVTLHTGSSTSCSTSAVPKTAVSTSPMGTTCASSPDANAGCAFQDNTPGAFGRGFNAAGGAVFALWIDQGSSANSGAGGVTVWKFPRSNVPADITSGSPNPLGAAWGKPQASWPATNGCKTKDVIGAQQIVFDITLCGGWCSSDYPGSGCPGTCAQQVMDPTNYNDAAWRVNSVKVYQ